MPGSDRPTLLGGREGGRGTHEFLDFIWSQLRFTDLQMEFINNIQLIEIDLFFFRSCISPNVLKLAYSDLDTIASAFTE